MGKNHTALQTVKREYNDRGTAQVDAFVDGLKTSSVGSSGTFDSAAAADFIKAGQSMSATIIPEKLQILMDEAGENSAVITRAIFDGIEAYENAHGCNVPADVVEQAIHSAYSLTTDGRRKAGMALDSASSLHQDNISLQPNRAVVAILATMSEAIPVAHYLPADIGSNEARLAIMTHVAKDTYGSYASGGLLDGTLSGGRYISTKRIHKCTIDGSGNFTGKLTAIQNSTETCDSSGAVVPLLRGRGKVYVNGVPVAREVSAEGTGASAISGQVTIGSTTYQIAGTINPDTGVIAGTTTPAIPTTTPIHVESAIDYERNAALVPNIVTFVRTHALLATPWRVNTSASIDARTQMSNELGLDPYSEGVIAIQAHFANERHYDVINYASRLAVQNNVPYDFQWALRSPDMTRSKLWYDFAYPLALASQVMAENTMNHGITHLYVGKNIAAQWRGLPADIWEPSGIADRPGIFRIGRLFGMFDVYYTPKGVTEAADGSSAEVLCVGRATDVTRNPFVLGDAATPMVKPLAVNADLNEGAAFYARNFTEVNPDVPSSLGCAKITITNLK